MTVQIKRVYEEPASTDGYRVLVDRLWPRGISKEHAKLDIWLKDIAPSTELREWFGHVPERFAEFSTKYQSELANNPATAQLQAIVKDHKVVTLLYGAHDETNNQAQVLLKYLQQ
jgi:DNA-3-methyladenine glycosylase